MRMILASIGRRRLATVSVFLIMLALVAGFPACNGGGESYTLTITSTTGGSVATPGEETYTYDKGTVISLVATPDDGYRFHVWTGDIGYIAAPTSASPNITMNGSYSITASFEQEGGPNPSQP